MLITDARPWFGCVALTHMCLLLAYFQPTPIAVVSMGLVYDNLVIAFSLGEGFNKPRFWLHTACTPLLAYSMTNLVVIIGLIGIGAILDIANPKREYVLVKYARTERFTQVPPSPPVAPILTTLIVLVNAQTVEAKLGAIIMILAAAAPQSKVGPLPGQLGEVFIAWGVWREIYYTKFVNL